MHTKQISNRKKEEKQQISSRLRTTQIQGDSLLFRFCSRTISFSLNCITLIASTTYEEDRIGVSVECVELKNGNVKMGMFC